MHQTKVAEVGALELLPEIEVEASKLSNVEHVVKTIQNETVAAAIQTLMDYMADRITKQVTNQLLARLGAEPATLVRTVVSPVVQPSPAPTPAPVLVMEPPVAAAPEPVAALPEVQAAPRPRRVKKAPVDSTPAIPGERKKRVLSDEARLKISESQKARWLTRPRCISPEAKAKIAESQRQRWATNRSQPRESSTEADCCNPHNIPDGVTPVAKEAVLATRDGYEGDSFYISEDGHYIGDDGFVVPKDFTEFMERFPRYLDSWVRRRLGGRGIEEDIEDWCQELIIHMKYLPMTSKHRVLGKTDVIQTFDPFAQYGASERRWRSYVNFVMANKFNTIHGKRSKNPVCRPGNMSIVSETNPEVHGEVTDEYTYSKSSYLTEATSREEKRKEDTFFAHKFIEFVQQNDPEIFPVLEAVYVAGSAADTIKEFCQTCKKLATTVEIKQGVHEGHEIGMTQKEFNRARNRLKQLAAQFIAPKEPILVGEGDEDSD
jgi:hypothetical protein